MLDSVWQLLANFGLDVEEIATSMSGLTESLSALKDFPIVGALVSAFESFIPTLPETTL